MKISGKKLVVIAVFIAGGCSTPVEEVPWPDQWQKGNLHTHSFWSDGDDYPEMIMEWYKSHGYQFVALSDHNILQEGERWISVTRSPLRLRAFEKYLNKFGEEWVEMREDEEGKSVRLKTLDEYRSKFDMEGEFMILKSEEITSSFDGKPIHINATNIQELIPGQKGGSVVETMQKVLDEVNAQRDRTGVPMIPHINHPNFGWGISVEDMIAIKGERFFEVYNGHPAVNNYGNESHISTEDMWDQINIAYLNQGKPLMYGIATDDSHNYHLYGSDFSNSGRGWIMVNTEELTAEGLIGAMEEGKFYSSTGVEIEEFVVNEEKIKFRIKGEEAGKYLIEFIGVLEGEDEAKVLHELAGTEAEYKFKGNEQFVRARISSNHLKLDPFEIGEYEMAWTQPVIPQK